MFDFASSTSLCLVCVVEPLVVIVDGDREHLLGVILADHVVVENLADFLRGRDAVARLHQRGFVLLADDVHAQFDAFVADEDGRAGNELAHLVLALAAERAVEGVLGIAAADLAHPVPPVTRFARRRTLGLARSSRAGLAKTRGPDYFHLQVPLNPARQFSFKIGFADGLAPAPDAEGLAQS